jgi:acyl dehydratase
MGGEDLRYYEDIEVGETEDCGSIEVDEAEMVAFAEQYDPQPFHVDEEAAADTMYGALIASGWYTCALQARLVFGNGLDDVATVGAKGIDDLRWHLPVYGGDTLSTELEVVEKHEPQHSGFGQIDAKSHTENQHGDLVLTLTALGFVATRDNG